MNTILTILRALLNDIDGTQYSDEALLPLIGVAAIIVTKEVDFDTDYTITIATISISPTPDNDFSLFVAYKSAILLLTSELRRFGYQNVKITDGPSSIDMSNISKSLKENLDTYVVQYDRMKSDYTMSRNLGHFITTPTTVNNLSVDNFEP